MILAAPGPAAHGSSPAALEAGDDDLCEAGQARDGADLGGTRRIDLDEVHNGGPATIELPRGPLMEDRVDAPHNPRSTQQGLASPPS
jgi:hypothetical protein